MSRSWRREAAAILVLVVASATAVAALLRPGIRSDGRAYYLWLEALVRDRTIDLGPATERQARFVTYHAGYRPDRGRHVSLFPFGTALLWAPFYATALALDRGLGPGPLDAWSQEVHGDSRRGVLAVALATALYAVAAVVLAYLACRRHAGTGIAAFAAMAGFLGTPLLYYAAREPTMSHAPATLLVAILVWLAPRARCAPVWLAAGLVLGLAGTVRWQLVLLGLPLAAWAARSGWRALAAFAAAAAVVFSTVPLSWLYMFGSPLPSAIGTVQTWLPGRAILWVVASPVHGLLPWAPVAIPGLAGLLWLALQRPTRSLGAGLLAMVATQVYMSATSIDPLGGWAFGPRRLTEMYPVLAVGLAALLAAAARRSRALAAAAAGATVAAVAVSLLLLLAFAAGGVHPGLGTPSDGLRAWLPPRRGATLAAVGAIGWFSLGAPAPGEVSAGPAQP